MKQNLTRLSSALILVLMLNGLIFAQSDINGTVLYHMKDNKPIPEVVVTLLDSDNVVVATTTTDLNGSYIFPAVPFGSYNISASSSIIPGGSNMADAQKIRQHLEGTVLLDPIEQLAADVASPTGIGWEDYNAIIDWFMQGNPTLENPWVFAPVNVEHTGTKTNVPTMGGSSSGDVNGTFVPTTRNLVELQVAYTDKPVSENFSIEVYASDIAKASAMGLELLYPESLVEINSVSGQVNATITRTGNGKLRISWISQSGQEVLLNPGKPVVVLEGNTTELYKGEEIRFNLGNASHFSNVDGEELETRYSLPVLKNSGNYLGINYPNPFFSNTNIDFIIPSDSRVTLTLYNMEGKVVRIIADDFMKAGIYNVKVDGRDLQPGIYFYSLKTDGASPVNETKRMIITR
ncbi:MAG TPA: hypothetical protein DF409_13435 [Bacteroidales bacterium]|jgi:hypothetical protein|nr:hypothetical protein [Bacteroidales bacterium]